MTTTAITENPFGLDETMEANAPVTAAKPAKVTKPRTTKTTNVAEVVVVAPVSAPMNLPALPITLTYGPSVIQKQLGEAIGFFVDGLPTSSGRPAQCSLASGVAVGDFKKYHQYLLSLSNLLEIAARRDREAVRLLMIVKCLIREGMSTESCLKAFAHLATGGTAYVEPHRANFVSACYNARRDQGENHVNVEQGCQDFGPVYDAFVATLPKYVAPVK